MEILDIIEEILLEFVLKEEFKDDKMEVDGI